LFGFLASFIHKKNTFFSVESQKFPVKFQEQIELKNKSNKNRDFLSFFTKKKTERYFFYMKVIWNGAIFKYLFRALKYSSIISALLKFIVHFIECINLHLRNSLQKSDIIHFSHLRIFGKVAHIFFVSVSACSLVYFAVEY
jgi:hypothetical protein